MGVSKPQNVTLFGITAFANVFKVKTLNRSSWISMALNLMISILIRDRKTEDIDTQKREVYVKTRRRLEGCVHKPRMPGVIRSWQRPGSILP